MNKLISTVTLVMIFIWLTGCGGVIPLTHHPLNSPKQQFSDVLLLQESVNDVREDQNAIGRTTITVFAITSGYIHTQTEFKQKIVELVSQALETIGYHVNIVGLKGISTTNSPIVKIEVDEFWFKDYTYFWPIVPTWGSIGLSLIVERPNGQIIFNQTFAGKGNSFCLLADECAFKTATSEALTDVLNQIVQELSGKKFHSALVLE